MNSFLAIALAAQVVVANPLVRRQVTSRATVIATTTVDFTTSIPEATETDTLPTPTATFSFSEVPTTTAGGSDGSYWFCSFPGSSEPTATYVPTDTVTASFPEITDSITFIETDTVTETDPQVTFTSDPVPTTDPFANITTLTSGAQTATFIDTFTDTFTDVPTVTLTSDAGTATFTDVPTDTFSITDFPTVTATATGAPGGWVSTYTIVGPETTAVIECVRIPGRGGHHHGPHYPPHHGTGPVTWSEPVPTSYISTLVTDTEFTDEPTLTSTPVSAATSTASV